jgi:prolyl oligopeptidase
MTVSPIRYPSAIRTDHVEVLCGQQIRDPYRWLEDDEAQDTISWEHAQDALYAHLSRRWRLPEHASALVEQLLDVGACTAPQVRALDGGRQRLAFGRRSPGQRVRSLVVRDISPSGAAMERTVFDPMDIDASGHAILTGWSLCPRGRYLAITTAYDGSDFSTLTVTDLDTGNLVVPAVGGLRYTSTAWRDGSGGTESLIYVASRPDRTDAVTLHELRLGTELVGSVMDPTLPPRAGMRAENSADGRWLVVSAIGETGGRDVWVGRLDMGPTRFEPFAVGTGASHQVTVIDDLAVVHTDLGAARGRVCASGVRARDPRDWRVVVPEDPRRTLTGVAVIPDRSDPVLALTYRDGLTSQVELCSLRAGTRQPVTDLPRQGTISGASASPSGDVWLTYTDHVTPPQILRLNVRTGSADTWYRAADVSFDDVSHTIVEYLSDDGTVVPMSLLARRDLLTSTGRPCRPLPTVLRVYGGFGVSMTPTFTPTALAWVKLGGAWAVPALRGGGEFGRQWHAAGSGINKQRTFDDGIAAARHLVASGWSATGRLAVFGESNGGLTAAALAIQQPSLFSAAVIIAPLFDMLRYEQSELGALWRQEYGSTAAVADLSALLEWSPYQGVRDGVRYPATLVIVFGGDTRVAPLHARKAVAALQGATSADVGEAPVVLRREAHTGHGSRSVDRMAQLVRDELAFLAAHTGLGVDTAIRTRQRRDP